jgi:hypothetical protein
MVWWAAVRVKVPEARVDCRFAKDKVLLDLPDPRIGFTGLGLCFK